MAVLFWVPSAHLRAGATGGIITTSGGYTVHTFTGSGTFTVTSPIIGLEAVIVGGGGGGGHQHAGGGGAGGVLSLAGLTPSIQSYPIMVGGGGAGCTWYPYTGTNGGNSSAFGYLAIGGGAGTGMNQSGNTGGSGGADGYPSGGLQGGAGTAGQGNTGNRTATGSTLYGGGGGGAGSAGRGIHGGFPLATWAGTFGGGGGGGYAGGSGGGAGAGNGGYQAAAGGHAAANSGSGGGGGGNYDAFGGNGGSGVVVIRYINNSAPTVSFASLPESTLLTAGSWYYIQASAYDGEANLTQIEVQARIDGGDWFYVAADMRSGSSGTSNPNGITAGAPGTVYEFRAQSRDTYTVSGWIYSGIYTVGNRAPTITWHTPPPSTLYTGAWYPIRATGYDPDGGLRRVWVDYRVNGGPWVDLARDAAGSNNPFTSNNNGVTAGLPGTTYQFRAMASDSSVDSAWLESDVYTVVNRAPTAAMSLKGGTSGVVTGVVGETLTITLSGGDADGNLRALNLWVQTPNTGWRNIRADNSIAGGFVEDVTTDNALSSSTNVASLGPVNRLFTVPLAEGFGTYSFVVRSIDSSGALSESQSVAVAVANRPPSGSFTIDGVAGGKTVSFGQGVILASSLSDADANLSSHSFWWDQGNGSTWTNPWNYWNPYSANATGWSGADAAAMSMSAKGGASSAKTVTFTPPGVGTYRLHSAGGDGFYWLNLGEYNLVVTAASIATAVAVAPISNPSYSSISQSVAVSASVSGSVVPSVGNVTFTLKAPAGGTLATKTVAVNALGVASTSLSLPESAPVATGYLVEASYAATAVGNYSWQASGGNRSFAIVAASPIVTWVKPANIVYGTLLSADQLNATASVPGAFVYSPPAGTKLDAGAEQALSVTFTPSDLVNNSARTGGQTLTVTKAPLTIAANDATRAYGAANPIFTVRYTGLMAGDSVVSPAPTSALTSSHAAGVYPGSIIPSPVVLANYSAIYVNGTLTISPTAQSVTLSDGQVSVSAGNVASASAASGVTNTYLASNSASGAYIWMVDGVVQPATQAIFTRVFASTGIYAVAVKAAANENYSDSAAATLSVTVAAAPLPSIAAGATHVLALKNTGTVWAWGLNESGQLGDGTTTNRPILPMQVGAHTGVISIAAGDAHSVIAKADGTVWGWGGNSSGQLGDASTLMRLQPVQVSTISGVIEVAAGAGHSLALKSDGTVWAWGANANGQLGDGGGTARSTPVRVLGLDGVVSIAAGASHSLAVKSDGTVWAWGANAHGQLGDGSIANRLTPVQVGGGLVGVVQVAAGSAHSVALKGGGSVWAWGANDFGQLGDGSSSGRVLPVQAGVFTNGLMVGAGSNHTLLIGSDGLVWTWGSNTAGQMGDNTTTSRLAPAQVMGLTAMISCTGGANRSVLLRSDGSVVTLGGAPPGRFADSRFRILPVPLRLVPLAGDSDQDGMLDSLEALYFGNLDQSGAGDSDSDDLSDVHELYVGTNPSDPYDNQTPILSIVDGDQQVGGAGQFNTAPLRLSVWNAMSTSPLINASVTFTVTSGGGGLAVTSTGSSGVLTTLPVRTDSSGFAEAYFCQPGAPYIMSSIRATAGSAQVTFTSLSTSANDSDGDQLLDAWELEHFGNLHESGAGDFDNDGLTNTQEMALGTDPKNADTDGDLASDGNEVAAGRNPLDRLDGIAMPGGNRLVLRMPSGVFYGLSQSGWALTQLPSP